jgi:hypothetical protein
MLAYEIDVKSLQELEAQLARNPAVVLEELEAAATEADLLLEREVKENMPTAHGTLRASVFHEEQVNDEGVIGLVGTPLTIVPVELGSRPHPPIEPLIDWVKVKFGPGDRAARGAASPWRARPRCAARRSSGPSAALPGDGAQVRATERAMIRTTGWSALRCRPPAQIRAAIQVRPASPASGPCTITSATTRKSNFGALPRTGRLNGGLSRIAAPSALARPRPLR